MLNLRIHSIKWKTSLLPKIALLIDAENISYKDLPRILEEVRGQGQIVLRAAYGEWQNPHLQKWQEIAEANGFKIRRQTSSLKKNSSDLKLIMDAMEVLYRTSINIFCLVSNDADYVPLCDKIHESKKRVIGVGYQRAAETFIRSCDRFIFIGRGEIPVQSIIPVDVEVPVGPPKPVIAPQPSPVPQQPPKSASLPDARKLLLQAFATVGRNNDGWVLVSALGAALQQIKAGFKSNNYGHSRLSKLLESMPDFVEMRGKGGSLSARLKK
jgi:uncharacterized protein (TIGR00288 family)